MREKEQAMDYFISPSYTHEKINNPSFSDLVDVIEDLWGHCIFAPIKTVLEGSYGDIAAMTILCSYYEAIESYTTGESSNNRSQTFFVNGFTKVFDSDSPGIELAAREIYKYIRCGLAHEGMLRRKVSYSRSGAKAFCLTYPKSDGVLDVNAGVESIIVNPVRMYEITKHHFDSYIEKLHEIKNQELRTAFKKCVEQQWEPNGDESIIGMTEAEFLGNA
ncbi:hypothetical protein MNBD_BACTEROID05-552 [hydrothermal vent metagenome]|uniref:Uncharacterized protein n=1 Tax=hydrothermal vent metagenome TaxID=652676 RepID=A0A3B0TGC4_9ZZZZ